jgi:hypothetical protein
VLDDRGQVRAAAALRQVLVRIRKRRGVHGVAEAVSLCMHAAGVHVIAVATTYCWLSETHVAVITAAVL